MSAKPIYHQSEIKTFLQCGMKWQFKYIDKIQMPGRVARMIGSVVGSAVSKNLAQKVVSKSDTPLDAVLSACSDEFEKRKGETIFDEEDTPGAAKDTAITVVKFHHENVAPKLVPASVEEQFVIETNAGYSLAGAIDYTEVDDMIGDGKVSSRQRASSHVVTRAFQPAMYDFAFNALRGRPAKGFRFDVITRPTVRLPAEYKPVPGVVTLEDHHWLFNGISATHKAIMAGVALPAPEGMWFCSEKWCEYWSICKGKK